MAGSKQHSKSRGTKASKRSLIKRSKNSSSSPVQSDINISNRMFFETTYAVCKTNVAFKQAVISAFCKKFAGAGPGTSFLIHPWADGYESSSSSEDDDWIDRLLSPQAMEEAIEQAMKEEAARKAREQERVDAIIAARTVHRIE
mmetsp:Transcript_13775/g.36612  ORF Transcript_13775/g.36612 Transcript_13775/m.36612 type:complete len:144 (-) Transcript_13775:40-471(-)